MNYTIILALLIPSLFIFPFIVSNEAYAVKINNIDIKLEVHFNKFDQPVNADLEALYDSLDDGTLENDLVTNMITAEGSPVTGQFNAEDDIEADWAVSTNNFTGENIVFWMPEIKEVNIKNGVNFGDLNDIVIDGARPTITNYLQTYGVTDFTWFLYYDGGLQIVEESLP